MRAGAALAAGFGFGLAHRLMAVARSPD